MTLSAYLERKGITVTGAAKSLGVTRVYLSEVVNGRRPGFALMSRIEKWTRGAVNLYSWGKR